MHTQTHYLKSVVGGFQLSNHFGSHGRAEQFGQGEIALHMSSKVSSLCFALIRLQHCPCYSPRNSASRDFFLRILVGNWFPPDLVQIQSPWAALNQIDAHVVLLPISSLTKLASGRTARQTHAWNVWTEFAIMSKFQNISSGTSDWKLVLSVQQSNDSPPRKRNEAYLHLLHTRFHFMYLILVAPVSLRKCHPPHLPFCRHWEPISWSSPSSIGLPRNPCCNTAFFDSV